MKLSLPQTQPTTCLCCQLWALLSVLCRAPKNPHARNLRYNQLIQLPPYPNPHTATASTAAPVGPLPRDTLLVRSLHRIVQYKRHTPYRLQLLTRVKLLGRGQGLPRTV